MRNGKWAIVLAAFCLVAAAVAVAYAAGSTTAARPLPEVIRAQRFEVVDAEGKLRGLLEGGDEGSVLWLYDKKGTARATLEVADIGPVLGLFDAEGRERALLVVRTHDPARGPVLDLYDAEGKALWHAP